jgi:hypothetical protein
MASSGSNQGSSIIAARRDKEYDHSEPDGYSQYQAECTPAHQDMISRSIDAVKPIISQSLTSRDDELWAKWFGADNNVRTDADVLSII